MKITVLDAATLGADLSLDPLFALGEVRIYKTTSPEEVADHAAGSDVLVLNKVRINAQTLPADTGVKLICVAATGTDNIAIPYCRQCGIAVCNVKGYSTDCVAQLTASMVLSLYTNLISFRNYVHSGAYSVGGVANCLSPFYHEIAGKTWGIVGYGHIGQAVGRIAEALGCRVLAYKRTPVDGVNCVDIDTLCAQSDILSIHLPLNDATRGLISRERIAAMKPGVVLVNTARGAVTDEAALAEAVKNGKIGGLGCDVYSTEPFPPDHPFSDLLQYENVCLTPHMAWGGIETRARCLDEICANIRAFFNGEKRSRVDII